MSAPTPGLYRHYKGGKYRVLHTGLNEATSEPVVVYQAQNETGQIWVRPVSSFTEWVDVDGVKIPRFTKIGN